MCFISLIEFSITHVAAFDNEKCQNQLNLFTQALEARESWALQLFDTWAKIQAGFLAGNSQNLGNFDHCVRFRYETELSGLFQGQHCYVQFQARYEKFNLWWK